MKIVTNSKLISRNSKVGLWSQIVGFAIMFTGLYLTFQTFQYVGAAYILVGIGLLISQFGIYYGNRWSRRPRPDELLDKALKGLDTKYTLYHYSSPVAHLLVGPAGIWSIIPRSVKGEVSVSPTNGKWKHTGGGTLFKLFGQEGLGRPDLDISIDTQRINRLLEKNMKSHPKTNAVLVFTNDDIKINVPSSAGHALQLKKLKNFLIRHAKQSGLDNDNIMKINNILQPNKKAESE